MNTIIDGDVYGIQVKCPFKKYKYTSVNIKRWLITKRF